MHTGVSYPCYAGWSTSINSWIPPVNMAKLGLALSGGGFRATLFHLGVVRFLRDAGALADITDIASVSGGSILAAHMLLNWEKYNGDDQQFAEAAAQIVRFVQFDVRNHIVRRLPLLYLVRFLCKLTPWRARKFVANEILERYYADLLYGDRCLHELPESPRLHILATSVSNGGLSVFSREGLSIQQRDAQGSGEFEFVAGQMARIPKVVGASSAFPGFFPPVSITAADLGVREGQFPTEWFTDGGVFDNLGIRTFSWLIRERHDFDKILVSDAGKPFQVLTNAPLGLIGQSARATDILWDRVGQLERENFKCRPEFLFIPITGVVPLADDPTSLHPVVQAEVQSIRTDLDSFSAIEINALARHGYEVARNVYRRHLSSEGSQIPAGPPWGPLPDDEGGRPRRSSRSASPATWISRKLRDSSRRSFFSSLLDLRDWPSYLYIALAAFLFMYLPYQYYELYQRAQTQATVIASVTRGDPDFHSLFSLINSDPLANWTDAQVHEQPEASTLDNSRLEVLTQSRIIDLRGLHRGTEKSGPAGTIYVRERLTVKLPDESDAPDRHIILRYPMQVREARFRATDSFIPLKVSRVIQPVTVSGESRTLYELDFDLTDVSLAEPVTLEAEAQVARSSVRQKYAKGVGHYKFETELNTDLVSIWLLFPTDLPYRTYSLVRYPNDRSSPPEVMQARFMIDHPYGTLIGWSVINPKRDSTYECRWSME
jgi:predicted acylesterase/phospholipase RssA